MECSHNKERYFFGPYSLPCFCFYPCLLFGNWKNLHIEKSIGLGMLFCFYSNNQIITLTGHCCSAVCCQEPWGDATALAAWLGGSLAACSGQHPAAARA
jgi:hypothetical protein